MYWNSIVSEFRDADLLLGNGFSRLFSQKFSYESLFETFLAGANPQAQSVFRSFGTTNFEAILEQLASAHHVNKCLRLDTAKIEETQAIVRNGLVKAIESNHPRNQDLDAKRLSCFTESLDLFHDIYTLNYDLILYHMIMLARDRHRACHTIRPYNDYFWQRTKDDWLQFMDFQHIQVYKHAYYLHGALFLFKDGYRDLKICREGRELVDEIGDKIKAGQIPLFISEGKSAEKNLAISRSNYLRFAHKHLSSPRDALVIFGTSLSDQDDHIVAAIKAGTKRVAVAVHTVGKTTSDIEATISGFQHRLAGLTVICFDGTGLFS